MNPGDFVVADAIGVAVIPLDRAEETLNLAVQQEEREQKTSEWVA
jgi:regulator of RNase E activity RraA